MHSPRQSLFSRDDTFFGVCEALGEDLGFNPQYLRAALAVPLLFSPTATFVTYAAAGVVVGVSRFCFPKPRQASADIVALEPAARREAGADELVAIAA